MTLKPQHYIPLVGILLLAAAVRILGVGMIPLWTDEGWSYFFVEAGNPIETVALLMQDRHPPLYFVIVALWNNLAGDSHLALRFVAIAGGLVTIALVYRMAADWFDPVTARYAALLLAGHELATYYTRELRHYGLLAFWVVLTSFLLLRYIRYPRRNLLIPYALSVTSLMLTHYFGLPIMLVQALFGLFIWRAAWRDKRKLILAWVAAFVLYLPWMDNVLPTLAYITHGVGGFPNSFQTNPEDLAAMLGLLLSGQLVLLGGLYIAGLLTIKRHSIQQLYIVVAGGGLFAFMLVVNNRVGLLSARMISFLTPFLMVIAGYGFSRMAPRLRVPIALLFVLVAAFSTPVIQPRMNQLGVAAILREQYAPGDLIVLETGWTDRATRYEIEQRVPGADGHIFPTRLLHTEDRIVPAVAAVLPDYDRVWVVQWLHAPVILPRLNDSWLGFRPIMRHQVEQVDPLDVGLEPTILVLYGRADTTDEPQVFGESIALHEVLVQPAANPGDKLHVDLWWQALESLPLDYSANVFLMDGAGQVVAQVNAALADTPSSAWIPGTLYHGRYTLTLPATLAPGDYLLQAAVYYYETPNEPLPVAEQPFAPLHPITITGQDSSRDDAPQT